MYAGRNYFNYINTNKNLAITVLIPENASLLDGSLAGIPWWVGGGDKFLSFMFLSKENVKMTWKETFGKTGKPLMLVCIFQYTILFSFLDTLPTVSL